MPDPIDPSQKLVQAATQAASAATEVVKVAGAVIGAEQTDLRTSVILANALREVFNENVDSGRFIDVTKIPLICRSISDMHINLAEIKLMLNKSEDKFVNQDQFTPVRYICYGLVGMVMTGFIGAVMTIVFRK